MTRYAYPSGAVVSDSSAVEVQRGDSVSGQVEITQIEGTGASGLGLGLTVTDSATVADQVEADLPEPAPAPSGGGPGDTADVVDNATLVIRDGSGNIKQEESVK